MSDPLSPSPDLERRVVAALDARGLLHRRRGAGRVVAALAAALTLVAIGFGAGTWRARSVSAGEAEPRFLLLLTDEAVAVAATRPAALGARVEEYRAWAVQLGEAGRLVGAEKLKDEVEVLGPGAADGTRVSGFFEIRAASREQALSIARSHPHLRYGGAIVLRAIDPL